MKIQETLIDFRKSERSNSQGGECVEVGLVVGVNENQSA